MRRRLAHIVFVTGFGTVALVVGLLAALTVASRRGGGCSRGPSRRSPTGCSGGT